MSKNTNLSFLTDYITADITNGRIGINNASPTVAFDVVGVAKFSSTVTATGSVGIGTTSPDALLTVAGANQASGAAFNTYGNVLIYSTDSFAINKGGALSLGGKYNSAGTPIATFARIHGKKENATVDSTAGYLSFETVPEATATLTERMRINSVGNVGIGNNAPRATLDVSDGTVNTSGEAIYQGLFTGPSRPSTSDLTAILTIQSNDAMAINKGGSIAFGGRAVTSSSAGANWAGIGGLKENGTGSDYSGYLQFWTRGGSSSEKMRITSGGNVGIGNTGFSNTRVTITGISTTSSNYGLVVNNSSNANLLAIRDDGNVFLNSSVYNSQTTGVPRTLYISSIDGNYIGGLVSIRASKKNIENVSDINWLYKLNPVTYNYRKKDTNGKFTEEIFNDIVYGLIAEDTASIADFLVNYNDKEDGTKEMLGIEYPRLITPMLKAIQELKAEIETLKQK